MTADWPILSATIWLPILGGALVLASGDKAPNVSRWTGAGRRGADLSGQLPLYTGFDAGNGADAVRREGAVDPGVQHRLLPGCRRHLDAADPADHLHHGPGDHCRLGGHPVQAGPVHGGLPDHGRAHGRRVRRARCDAVLRLLGGDADPDVHHHRRLGRAEPRLRDDQVLPLHLPRLGVHAGRADLPVFPVRLDRDPGLPRPASWA